MNKVTGFLLLLIILGFGSCSTKPKSSGEVYNLRSYAEKGLEAANKDAEQGNFYNAEKLLIEYKRMAVMADDPSLITRICLSYGNVLLSLGKTDDAYIQWDQAIAEAQKSNNGELLSTSRIFKARGNLLSGRESAQSVLDEVNREIGNIKTNNIYIAYSWQTKGLAQRALNLYREAEDSLKRSLDIHEKEKTLENASYDWYIIASIRSMAGDTQGALQALETAISIDRRIENTFGLAANWKACGDVYRKMGRDEDAVKAYERSRAIYEAMGNKEEAAAVDNRIKN
jgi:tetratricopeptide (TPR) repeat protein